MSFPEQLAVDRLYLFVFGPGRGESIIVRVPPAHWLVVDSCRIGEKAAAKHVLDLAYRNDSYRGELACIVLTHPHRDHYRLFSQVLSAGNWTRVGCNHLKLDDACDRNPSALRANEREQIAAEIRSAWKQNHGSQWLTWRTAAIPIGHATLTVLHPPQAGATANAADENYLSSAMLLEWKNAKIVLGADVKNPHWAEICHEFADRNLPEHAAMKVAHHASENGVFDGLLSDRTPRFWVATPFNSESVPKFEDNHGPDVLLRKQSEIYLTGLPTAHDRQMEAPCEATRAELRAGVKPQPISFQLSHDLIGEQLPRYDTKEVDCYVVVSADENGTWRTESYGSGSVRVKR